MANGAFYKKRPAVRRPRVVGKTALVKTIKRVINSSSETKMAILYGGQTFPGYLAAPQQYPATPTAHNGSISTTSADIHALIPALPKGNDDFQRIGTQVKPTSLVLDLDVSINPT